MFIWEIEKLRAVSQKGGCQTKASILSFILGASEAGATDATWQCSGHRLATRPRQTVAAPPRFHDNSLETNTKQRHLPRQEKARSCPAPPLRCTAKLPAGAGMNLPWEDPCPRDPTREIPFSSSKVPPRIQKGQPLRFFRAEMLEFFLLRGLTIHRPHLLPRTANQEELGLPSSIQNVQPRSGILVGEVIWGRSPRAQYLLDLSWRG